MNGDGGTVTLPGIAVSGHGSVRHAADKIQMGHTKFNTYLFNCTTKKRPIEKPDDTEDKIVLWVLKT